MDANQFVISFRKYADNILDYLKKSTKNIEWTMEVEITGWDCQVKFKGSYLDYHSWVYSSSVFMGKSFDGFGNGFNDYVLYTTIHNLSKELFVK